uniref:HORMA domain-containing protein n=1 Tax=Steinernema glaseri TaxID=37863 RepID=A0A1I8ANF0_9BILA
MANGTRNANCGLRKFKMLIFSEAIIAYCKEMISTADFPFLIKLVAKCPGNHYFAIREWTLGKMDEIDEMNGRSDKGSCINKMLHVDGQQPVRGDQSTEVDHSSQTERLANALRRFFMMLMLTIIKNM